MKKILRLFCLLILMGLVTACSNMTSSQVPSTAKATAVSSPTSTSRMISSPLVGTYTMTLTEKDVASAGPVKDNVMLGTWTLKFGSDGYFTALSSGFNTIGSTYVGFGSYTVRQNQFTEIDNKCYEFWSMVYGPVVGTGTYVWSLQGNRLTLKVVKDICPARILIFTSHPLLRQA